MPYSDTSLDKKVQAFIKAKKYQTYLDVGCGAGKYGQLIREVIKKPYIEAIESEKGYIKEFNLHRLYDKVYVRSVVDFFDDKPDYVTNVVTIGDCLEHLKKSDGLDLINFLIYRCSYIIIVFTIKHIEFSWKGHASEAHRSVWTKADFSQFDYQYFKKGMMNMIILKGYLEDDEATRI